MLASIASKQQSSRISPYLPCFLTQGRNPERRLPWSMTRFGAGTGRWSALAWTAAGSWRGPATALKLLAPDSEIVDELELDAPIPSAYDSPRISLQCRSSASKLDTSLDRSRPGC